MNRVAKLVRQAETVVAAGLYIAADVLTHRHHKAPK